jgi:hypothetical protein
LRRTVREKVVRPPAFEISATPNRNVLNYRELQRAIDPSAAGPFRRRNRPVWMIIKGNENARLLEPAQPKCGEIMKVAGAVHDKRREAAGHFVIKTFHHALRGTKTKARTPFGRFNRTQSKQFIWPRAVEPQISRIVQNLSPVESEKRRTGPLTEFKSC